MIEIVFVLSSFVGIGMFFDHVLMGSEEKRRLKAYLSSWRSSSATASFINFLSQANQIVFSRFFSQRFLDRRFVIASACLSVFSFLLVIVVQAIVIGDKMERFFISVEQIVLLALLLLLNIVFDYTSIVQTKIFVDAAVKSNSIFRSIVILFSDVLFTINAFILAFSAILLIVLAYYTYRPVSIELYPLRLGGQFGTNNEFVRDMLVTRYGLPQAFSEQLHTQWVPILMISGNDRKVVRYVYIANFDQDPIRELVDFIEAYPGVSFEAIEVVDQLTGSRVTQAEEHLEEYSKALAEGRSPIELKGQLVRATIRLKFASWGGWAYAYSSAFYNVDRLEDGFPEVLFSEATFVLLESVAQDAISTMSVAAPAARCYQGEKAVSLTSVAEITDCENLSLTPASVLAWPIFPGLSIPNVVSEALVMNRNMKGLLIPGSTLFLTSLLPSFLFLFSSICLFFATAAHAIFSRTLPKAAEYIARAPFGITSLFLGFFYLSVWQA